MKKLIFIDNDDLRIAKEDVDYIKDFLEYRGGLTEEQVNTIEIISNFNELDRDKALDLLFSNENCICTWSSYTATHKGSLYQLFSFLASAGSNWIKNKIYIDATGNIVSALERNLRDLDNKRDLLNILQAIETNYILTNHNQSCVRLRLELKGTDENLFKFEPANLKELLDVQ